MTAEWNRVVLDESRLVLHERIRGVEVSLAISPYDLPRAFRGVYLEDRGVLRVEFRYADEEPCERVNGHDCVSFEVGKHSRKLYAIEVEPSRHKVGVVKLTVAQALDHVDAAVRRLRDTCRQPNARLNYEAVDEVLRENREHLVLTAA